MNAASKGEREMSSNRREIDDKFALDVGNKNLKTFFHIFSLLFLFARI